jgi:hypothetical protein
MADNRALTEAVRYLRSQGENDLADPLADADLGPPSQDAERAPRLVVEDEDEAWRHAAGATAWKAIVDARARAGRPIE